MSDSPQFETTVAVLASEQELYALIGLLDAYMTVDNVLSAFREQPRFDQDQCNSLISAEIDHFGNMVDVVACAIERLSPADKFERNAQVNAMMRWASRSFESRESVAMIARIAAKPIVPQRAKAAQGVPAPRAV